MAKRDYPNKNFAWFNDEQRVGIVCIDTTSTTTSERTTELYDSYQGDDVTSGLRITVSSKYETIDAQTDDLRTDGGLDSGLHVALLCYVKSRLFEDSGDLQKAQYFREMYDKKVKQYPLRKSGVRNLAVPKL